MAKNKLDEKRKEKKKSKKKKTSIEKKKKSKKSSSKKSHRRSRGDGSKKKKTHSSSDSDQVSSGSDNEVIIDCQPDLLKAMSVVEHILVKFPALAPDLMNIFKMLDSKEVVAIGGIENLAVREQLLDLFSVLRLKECGPNKAYKKQKVIKEDFSEIFQVLLQKQRDGVGSNTSKPETIAEKHNDDQERHEKPKIKRSIGPSKPTDADRRVAASFDNNNGPDDDDEFVGPALPGMVGFRKPDKDVEERMLALEKTLEKEKWRELRGESNDLSSLPKATSRDEWMVEMPKNKTLNDSLGGLGDSKHRQFRSKEKQEIDASWFDTPQKRERANREKVEMELLGYVRGQQQQKLHENDDIASKQHDSINESILPSADPEQDEMIRIQMEAVKAKRGKSLVEKHREKLAFGKKNNLTTQSWDRDRDLTLGRNVDTSRSNDLMNEAGSINSRFTAPKMTRQFL